MTLIISNENQGTYELCPPGNHVARCIQIVDLGTQETEFMGKRKMLKQIRINWELPAELKVFKEENGEQPFIVGKTYTLSLFEKANLRQALESWRGKPFTEEELKGFDILVLLGKPCMLNIVHGVTKAGRDYAKITSVTPMPKGMFCPDQINASKSFSLQSFDEAEFDALSEWLQDTIKKSIEYKAVKDPTYSSVSEDTEEDDGEKLPF
jgi:hypothetical protein